MGESGGTGTEQELAAPGEGGGGAGGGGREGGVCVLSRLWSTLCSRELPTQSVCPRCCSEYMLSAGLSTSTRRCLVTLAPQSTLPSAQSPP